MSGNDELMAQLFGRAPRVAEYVMSTAQHESSAVIVKATMMPRATGGRYIERKPNVGPRGGEGDRAKTKAARKANLRRRKKT